MKLIWRYVCLLLVATATISFLSFAKSQSVGAQQSQPSVQALTEKDKTLSPYFFVQGDPSVDQLPLKDRAVKSGVSGVSGEVEVLQTYRIEGSRRTNARYVFPASTRAAVYSMRMRIGDQVVVAKIKEREKAQQEFEKAKEEGKSA